MDINLIQSNRYNPKETKEHLERYQAIKDGIVEMGMKSPIDVRELPDGKYEIIDGYHRWKACKELGWTEIPISSWGKIDEITAKKITILKEKARIPLDIIKTSELLKELVKVTPLDKLIKQIGYNRSEFEADVALSAFDWEQYKGEELELENLDKYLKVEVDLELLEKIKKIIIEYTSTKNKKEKKLFIIGVERIKLLETQMLIIRQAIEKAKKEGETKSPARALELICADYLAG